MSLYSSKKRTATKNSASVLNRTLTRSKVQMQVPFLKEKIIPAGTYTATIVSVSEAITNGGDEAIDVVYKLCDPNGRIFETKERLIWDSRPYYNLVDHLIDTGLLGEGSVVGDMVGACETVTVVYPYKGAFGSFQDRQPCQQKPVAPHKVVKQDLLAEDPDEDEEDDDDLLDDDD